MKVARLSSLPSGVRIDLDGRILGTIFWAALVNTVFLIFSMVRIFAAKEVRYGLADLFRPQFYLANPIFIVLMVIGPVTFISDLMVFSAAGEVSTKTLGLLGLSALNLVGVIFGFVQFVLVNILFRTEQVPNRVWMLLALWFIFVVSGTLTGTVIMSELSKH
ncbi:hypothetical protein FDZ71_03750 [bacterium]|nr:MAG: hypothetical protein FDZ71_03750 [bacterium]